MGKPKQGVLILLAFFAIYVIWGSTYLLNKISVSELEPFMLASIRFITAGLLIFIIAKILGMPIRITRQQLINNSIAGFLFLTFGNGVAVWALKYIDSGFAALEISAQPLVVLILMRVLEGKRIKFMSMIGVVLGIIGIYLLVNQSEVLAKENSLTGIIMIFACMLSWGYGSIFVAKADLSANYFVKTAYQMLTGGIMLAIASLFFGEEWSLPHQWSAKVQFSMVALIIFGGIVAFTSFNYLLKKVSPEKVATSTYVNPIVALFLGWYFLEEVITVQSIIAALILLTGVYFINTTRPISLKRKSETEAAKKV
jgi:drug/metabolite transporter (DMT)-like permease